MIADADLAVMFRTGVRDGLAALALVAPTITLGQPDQPISVLPDAPPGWDDASLLAEFQQAMGAI